jgi:Helix-turn-helix domain
MPVVVPELISDVELAKRWNVSPRWVQNRFRSGEFPGRKISRKWFVTEDDIAEILKRIAIPVKDAKIMRSPDAPTGSSMTNTTVRRMRRGDQ